MQDIIEHADLYNENGQVIYGTLHINFTQCLPELERLFFLFFCFCFWSTFVRRQWGSHVSLPAVDN
jgi:hypothetical protein